MEHVLADPPGVLALPATSAARCAVLVLSGSSGRIETERVRLLARHGAAAMSVRWFGAAGQPPGICEVALETFEPFLDRLASMSSEVAVLGLSKGAEAALLLARRDPRITAVGAFSPTSVVWANVGPARDGQARPQRSSWTERGNPLPFVPYDDEWQSDATAFRRRYEQSLRAFPARVEEAAIEVERIGGRVLLTAGEDDQVWPADWFADRIAARRAAHGLATEVLTDRAAGHRISFPGEAELPADRVSIEHGGSRPADAAFGRRVWPALLDLLRLG